jgi:hypothetical protein
MATVRVDRITLINTLRTKVAEAKVVWDAYDKEVDAYEKARKKNIEQFKKDVLTGKFKNEQVDIHVREDYYARNWNAVITLEFPEKYKGERPQIDCSVPTRFDISEIEGVLRLLEMTTDDRINVSLLKNISRYL